MRESFDVFLETAERDGAGMKPDAGEFRSASGFMPEGNS
jgi:hypothetical protein